MPGKTDRLGILVWLMLGSLAVPLAAQDPAEPPTKTNTPAQERSLEYWVEQLSNDQFLRREAATRQISKAGLAAVPALTKAIQSGDLETTERAIELLGKIALEQSPIDETGAWAALVQMAENSAGSRKSRARVALEEIWKVRESQAGGALEKAGVFVGIDDFALGQLTSPVMMVRIDEQWSGDLAALGWLRWLPEIKHVAVVGESIRADVIENVMRMPDLTTVALVEGKLDVDTLAPLRSMKPLDSLEIRYIRLSEDVVDEIADLPLRLSLNLMGTGVDEARVDLIRKAVPGLAITHRQGGFLGVTCLNGDIECRIRNVLPDSAAEDAGLRSDDRIIAIDQAPVQQFSDLQKEINQHLPGDTVRIKFVRDGKEFDVTLKLGKYQE